MQDVSSIQDKLLFYTVAKRYSTPSISKPTPPLCHTTQGVAYWRELGEPPYQLKFLQKMACLPSPPGSYHHPHVEEITHC